MQRAQMIRWKKLNEHIQRLEVRAKAAEEQSKHDEIEQMDSILERIKRRSLEDGDAAAGKQQPPNGLPKVANRRVSGSSG